MSQRIYSIGTGRSTNLVIRKYEDDAKPTIVTYGAPSSKEPFKSYRKFLDAYNGFDDWIKACIVIKEDIVHVFCVSTVFRISGADDKIVVEEIADFPLKVEAGNDWKTFVNGNFEVNCKHNIQKDKGIVWHAITGKTKKIAANTTATFVEANTPKMGATNGISPESVSSVFDNDSDLGSISSGSALVAMARNSSAQLQSNRRVSKPPMSTPSGVMSRAAPTPLAVNATHNNEPTNAQLLQLMLQIQGDFNARLNQILTELAKRI
jgi:hypothetical protein